MKKDPLDIKLENYFKELQNPKKIIGKWIIVDEKLLKKLNKITLNRINGIYSNTNECIIDAEIKDKFIIIKSNVMFIAVKIVNTEYNSIIDNWSLIGVNKQYLYGGIVGDRDNNKNIFKLLGLKLSKKALLDLDYFDSI